MALPPEEAPAVHWSWSAPPEGALGQTRRVVEVLTAEDSCVESGVRWKGEQLGPAASRHR
jgi:hypothetical protein